jgi:hypothetical protein
MVPFPMFPLGSVLFPGAVLALQIFEPRYRQLVVDLAAHDNRFGVVLIRRGHEVGGGDERHEVGTIAEVVQQEESGDGLYLLSAVGRERIRVTRWLQDDPYPRALVEDIRSPDPAPELAAAVASAANARKQVLGIAVEMGADGVQLDLRLPDDPEQAAWALCSASPIGPFDRQRLLETDDAVARLGDLEAALNARAADLRRAMQA